MFGLEEIKKMNEKKVKKEEKIKSFDKWLYPEDLDNKNLIVNLVCDGGEYYANFYSLPENWKEKVTNNSGKDGKLSIHDLMKLEI